jgi:hypothetical protein
MARGPPVRLAAGIAPGSQWDAAGSAGPEAHYGTSIMLLRLSESVTVTVTVTPGPLASHGPSPGHAQWAAAARRAATQRASVTRTRPAGG